MYLLYSTLHKILSNNLNEDHIWLVCEYAQLSSFETVVKYNMSGVRSLCVSDSTLYYISSNRFDKNLKLVIELLSNCRRFPVHSFNISRQAYDFTVSDLYIYVFKHNAPKILSIDIYDKNTYSFCGNHRLPFYFSDDTTFTRSQILCDHGYIYVFITTDSFVHRRTVHKISEIDLACSVEYTDITYKEEKDVDCIKNSHKYNYYGISPIGDNEYLTSAYACTFSKSSLPQSYVKLNEDILLVYNGNELIFMNKVIPKKPSVVPEYAQTIGELFLSVKKLIFG